MSNNMVTGKSKDWPRIEWELGDRISSEMGTTSYEVFGWDVWGGTYRAIAYYYADSLESIEEIEKDEPEIKKNFELDRFYVEHYST